MTTGIIDIYRLLVLSQRYHSAYNGIIHIREDFKVELDKVINNSFHCYCVKMYVYKLNMRDKM